MVQVIHQEDLSPPIQCETNRTGLNGFWVYGDRQYAKSFISEGNYQFSGVIPQHEENLVLRSQGSLTPDGLSQLSPYPVLLNETANRVIVPRSREDGPWVPIMLTSVILLLFILFTYLYYKS